MFRIYVVKYNQTLTTLRSTSYNLLIVYVTITT